MVHRKGKVLEILQNLTNRLVLSWPWLARVRRVQLHPSILGNGCMHPSIFRADTCYRLFCLIFSANSQILHPSIEISNQGTACQLIFLVKISQKPQKFFSWIKTHRFQMCTPFAIKMSMEPKN